MESGSRLRIESDDVMESSDAQRRVVFDRIVFGTVGSMHVVLYRTSNGGRRRRPSHPNLLTIIAHTKVRSTAPIITGQPQPYTLREQYFAFAR